MLLANLSFGMLVVSADTPMQRLVLVRNNASFTKMKDMDMSDEMTWRACSTCKKPIAFQQCYLCNVDEPAGKLFLRCLGCPRADAPS